MKMMKTCFRYLLSIDSIQPVLSVFTLKHRKSS